MGGLIPDTMRPLGAYIAKRCPRRVQLDIVQPVEQVPAADDVVMRLEAGVAFEASIVECLRSVAVDGWVFAGDDVAATLAAIEAGASVIVDSRLPPDVEEWRSGAPDLLVWDGDGYLPIDVKHHKTFDDGDGLRASDLADPTPTTSSTIAYELRARKDDALQLAHYRRMLQRLGVASSGSAGGLIGKEGVVAWYELDAPMWQTPAKSDNKKRQRRTTMEAYDFECGIRRDWAADAHRHLADPSVELLVPVRIGDCGSCGWDAYCTVDLEARSGDASLLPGIGYRPWRQMRDLGVESRAGVAALDYPTPRLGKAGVDLRKWLDLASDAPGGEAVADLNPRAKKQVGLLEESGILTADGVLTANDSVTAGFDGAGFLPEAILNARAATGPKTVYVRPRVSEFDLPRADIELDIDMENLEEGVYLWGVWLSDRGGTGLVEEGFVPFVTWDPLDDHTEMEVFGELWTWLRDVSRRAAAAGASLKSYCWHESAENTQLRRIARRDDSLLPEVESFIESGAWVDLEKEFKQRWITGGSTSLKAIAPLAGFEWDVDDPGGGIAMVRYGEAVAGFEAAQAWLMTYNEGDVRATWAIREWLGHDRARWEEVEA